MDAVEIVETANTERKLAVYDSARTARTQSAHTPIQHACVRVRRSLRACVREQNVSV